MQKITFMAFKGGAGKSTALFLMTSVLNRRGIRVGLVDADENKSVLKWERHARGIGTWDDENIKVYDGWGEDRFEEAFEQAERDNPDYLLIDTKGGGSDLNQTAALNADLIVIPTDLGVGEIDIALETMEYVMNLLNAAEMDIPTAFLLSRVMTDDNKFTEANRTAMRIFEDLPAFEGRIPTSAYYKDMAGTGPMNLYADYLRTHDKMTMRARAPQTRLWLNKAEPVVDEILAALPVKELA